MDRVYELAPGAKAQLHALVKTRLIETSEYNDDVLPEYIVVMVGNRKSCAHLCEDLEAFLGKEGATAFSLWLWDTLSRSPLVVASPDLAKPKYVVCCCGSFHCNTMHQGYVFTNNSG
eukprot:TRINITY_DN3703_c0_g1_i5.p2 TRINITY_DN3703_c0_g1~~TRINITY_DN3703_c0_g1_i5.p2  ORF type:complete len:117 (+),score=7.31 TRINITY_DN3703_c0_g1_i5:62-412(+)